MPTYTIRVFGDPVLRQRAEPVGEVDEDLVRLAGDMIETMYAAPGVGLAAPQVGVGRRMFVYDVHDGTGAHVVLNPEITEQRGEWVYEEGCLSVPGLSWPIKRPKEVCLHGFDLEGNELSIDADELLARCFLHELDHLDGVLLLERLDADQHREAMRVLRARALGVEQALSGSTPWESPAAGPAPGVAASAGGGAGLDAAGDGPPRRRAQVPPGADGRAGAKRPGRRPSSGRPPSSR